MFNTFLISFDPNINNWESVKGLLIKHSSDRFIKIYEGAIVLKTIEDRHSTINSLVSNGLKMFLVVPIDQSTFDGVLESDHWQYIKKNIF